jgi:enoyl-CoA hydratase
MKFKHLTIEKERHVATVTFNRPDALNALTVQLMHEIIATAEAFREDVETRVVIFTGAGKCFCAGLDLTDIEYIQRFQEDSMLMKLRFLKLGPRMVKAIYDMDQITIAAVNGAATGGGACIAAACDFRVGANDCLVGYPEVGLGMNLSWVALPMCVNLIGPSKAKKMVILAKKENAATLLKWGFLDEVVPAEDLPARARKMAETYASKPPIAAQMVKRSVNAIASALDQAIMHMDADQFLLSSKTKDFTEGITAFLEKREPRFKGN